MFSGEILIKNKEQNILKNNKITRSDSISLDIFNEIISSISSLYVRNKKSSEKIELNNTSIKRIFSNGQLDKNKYILFYYNKELLSLKRIEKREKEKEMNEETTEDDEESMSSVKEDEDAPSPKDINTDNKDRLTSIFSSILDIVEKEKIKVIFPMHPRTSKMMNQILDKDIADAFVRSEYINIIPPVSFLDMIALEKDAKVVVTDFGGVQKESFFDGRPSIILRNETEWMDIVENGAGILTDADNSRIMEAYKELTSKKTKYSNAFGDGNASKYIIAKILDYLS